MTTGTANTQLISGFLLTSNANRGFIKYPIVYETGPSPIDASSSDRAVATTSSQFKKFSSDNFGQLADAGILALPTTDANTMAFSFLAMFQDGDMQLLVPANNLVQRLLNISHGLLENALKKCRDLLEEIDVSDENSRENVRARLKDVFEIFSDLSSDLIRELVLTYEDRPDVVGFVLSDCFVEVDSVKANIKVDVISRLTMNSAASIRYEAVRALDAVNNASAMRALRWLRSSEKSGDVKRLIDESLKSYAVP